MPSFVQTWTFDSGLENWAVSGVITRATNDGSPNLGCLNGNVAGRNTGGNNNGQATWSGTYTSLGLPIDATITGMQATLMKKQALVGAINNCYWELNSGVAGMLIDGPDDLTSFDWTQIAGPPVNSLSIPATNSLDLTLDCSIRTGNDKNASIDLWWDTIELTISYETPFTAPSVTTNNATLVEYTTATLNGELTSLGESTSVDVFFEYRVVGATTWIQTTRQTTSAIGAFNQAVSGLQAGTSYEFRAVSEYENHGTQAVHGNTLTFETIDILHELTVAVVGSGTTTPIAGVHSYSQGTVVNLSASPDSKWIFEKWVIDGLDVTSSETTVTMSEPKTVTAYFVSDPDRVFIERSTDEVTWQLIAEVDDPNISIPASYDDASVLVAGTTYYYRARRYEDGEYSEWSNTVSILYETASLIKTYSFSTAFGAGITRLLGHEASVSAGIQGSSSYNSIFSVGERYSSPFNTSVDIGLGATSSITTNQKAGLSIGHSCNTSYLSGIQRLSHRETNWQIGKTLGGLFENAVYTGLTIGRDTDVVVQIGKASLQEFIQSIIVGVGKEYFSDVQYKVGSQSNSPFITRNQIGLSTLQDFNVEAIIATAYSMTFNTLINTGLRKIDSTSTNLSLGLSTNSHYNLSQVIGLQRLSNQEINLQVGKTVSGLFEIDMDTGLSISRNTNIATLVGLRSIYNFSQSMIVGETIQSIFPIEVYIQMSVLGVIRLYQIKYNTGLSRNYSIEKEREHAQEHFAQGQLVNVNSTSEGLVLIVS